VIVRIGADYLLQLPEILGIAHIQTVFKHGKGRKMLVLSINAGKTH
jgi:hypothetical protein